MNNLIREMKEICDVWVKIDGKVISYTQDEIHLIYDYISKLEQENKKLKETLNLMGLNPNVILFLEQENKELQKENQSLRTRIKTIKRRRKHQTQKLNKYKLVVTDLRNALEKKNNKIDKAINYIKEQGCYDEDCNVFCNDLNYYAIPRLLEILEKDSDVDE